MLAPDKIIYPDSDGQPMADNTKQFRWIATIHGNLEWLFRDDDLVFCLFCSCRQFSNQARHYEDRSTNCDANLQCNKIRSRYFWA
jgi:hypothetical protein